MTKLEDRINSFSEYYKKNTRIKLTKLVYLLAKNALRESYTVRVFFAYHKAL